MKSENSVNCLKCGANIDINSALYNKIHKSFDEDMQQKRAQYKKAMQELENRENSFDKELQNRLQSEQNRIYKELKAKVLDEQNESISKLQEELNDKSNQLKELNRAKIELEQVKREKDEVEDKLRLEFEHNFTNKLKEEQQKAKRISDSENELRIKEQEEQLNTLRKELESARQKASQGSMQLQGEAQEVAMENYLKQKFPLDTILEIKKGAKGGDSIQIINSREIQNCGKIYYESKRTKEFQKSWIEKFKTDMREEGTDVGVIVTQVLPKDFDRMGIVDGVWVCTFDEFKSLSLILRDSIIKLALMKNSQENRKDKMGLIYDYLIGSDFKMQVEAIVEGFTIMQNDLMKEKRSMERIWKNREKQLDKVLSSTLDMHCSIKAIAGSSISSIKSLELIDEEDEANEEEIRERC